MYLVQTILEVQGGWYLRALATMCIIIIPGMIPLLMVYLISTFTHQKTGVEITCTNELEKLTTFFNGPVKAKTYLSKRSGLTMTYKMHGEGSKILFLAAGLGCREYLWYPIVKHLASEGKDEGWTFVTWWYRGMFGADTKDNMSMSIEDMAEDAKELLDELRVERGEHTMIDVLFGWSAGVQVALQFALLYPDSVDKLILNCGTHGNLAQTFLQPFCRFLPASLFFKYAARITREVIRKFANEIVFFGEKFFIPFGGLSLFGIGSLPMWMLRGRPVGRWLFQAYMEEYLCNGPEHLRNYLHFTVELDKHSVYDKLHEIRHKTLVLTGFLDVMTPSYLSYEIHSALPNCEIRCWSLGTHFIHIEYPVQVCKEIQEFLARCKHEKVGLASVFGN